MPYKAFRAWCNDRASDGCWGLNTALICIDVMGIVQMVPFWRRERVWQRLNKLCRIEEDWVNPTNRKIEELRGAEE